MKNSLFWLSILLICVLLGWKAISLLFFAIASLAIKAVLLVAVLFLALLAWELLKRKRSRLKS